MKHLKSSNKGKNVLLISSLPDIRLDIWKPDIQFFNIQYPAGYWIAEKWLDFAGYRILNRISGQSLLIRHDKMFQGWQLCDGSEIQTGPMMNLYTPNLNSEGRFLRGGVGFDSWTFQDQMTLQHRQ